MVVEEAEIRLYGRTSDNGLMHRFGKGMMIHDPPHVDQAHRVLVFLYQNV